MQRLLRAFSLKRTLSTLVAAPPDRLRAVDGLRAFSVLWVVVFHTAWHLLGTVPLATYAQLLGDRAMLPAWRGAFGVDVFFVLSGFLIAGMLLDEQRETGSIALGRFYLRRLLRLWPAMAVAVYIDTQFTCERPGIAWSNLLYVSNFQSIGALCAGWTWSLSIEEQFYLVCPWLLLGLTPFVPRTRFMLLGVLLVLLAGVGASVVVAGGYSAFDAEIVINRPLIRWIMAFDDLYAKPWMRAAPLLEGVTAAFLYRSPRFMERLSRATVGSVVAFGVALGVAFLAMQWPLVAGASRVVEVAYLASYRTLFGACITVLLLLALSQGAVGQRLGRVLSTRLLTPIAQLAYAAYLLNPIVVAVVHRALAPRFREGRVTSVLVLFVLDLVGTFLAATVLYVLVERPIMDLRPVGDRRMRGAGASLS
jgi:peptidoglycan/LPS O-acetylase OafA/YrhL